MLVAEASRPESSPFARKFARAMAEAAAGRPILDVACGSGRNSVLLAELGCAVICIDRELSRLRSQSLPAKIVNRLTLLEMDLLADSWPFEPETVGGALMVDFLHPSLFPLLCRSLGPAACLLIETISARGGNYRELPRLGELRTAFETSFDLEWYKERKVTRGGRDAVTVKLFGRRTNPLENLVRGGS